MAAVCLMRLASDPISNVLACELHAGSTNPGVGAQKKKDPGSLVRSPRVAKNRSCDVTEALCLALQSYLGANRWKIGWKRLHAKLASSFNVSATVKMLNPLLCYCVNKCKINMSLAFCRLHAV